MIKKLTPLLISTITTALLFHGCSSSLVAYSNLKQENEILKIKRIGVLPFVNESGKRGAGEIVANIFISVIFKSGIFDVEERGNIERFLLNEKVKNVNAMDIEQIKRLGERLNIDAVFVGTVEEFSGSDKGDRSTTPVVGIRVRLIDIKTGKIVWMVRHKRRGEDYVTAFGFGRIRSISALTKRIVSEIIETIK